jgi:hypothetical protein
MNRQSVKNFLSNIFVAKHKELKESKHFADCSIHRGLSDVTQSLQSSRSIVASLTDSIGVLIRSPMIIRKLDKIQQRIDEIAAFTKTQDFATMVLERPADVQKLRDELDALVAEANSKRL